MKSARTAGEDALQTAGCEARRVPSAERRARGARAAGCPAACAPSSPLRPALLGVRPPIARAWPPDPGSTVERVALRPRPRRPRATSRGARPELGAVLAFGSVQQRPDPMAPQRRGAPKAPEGSEAAERRRRSRYPAPRGGASGGGGRGQTRGRGLSGRGLQCRDEAASQARAARPGRGVRTPDGNSGRETFPGPEPVCRGSTPGLPTRTGSEAPSSCPGVRP